MPYVDIKDANAFYSAIHNTSDLIVIDFYATWCGPCRQIAPLFVEIAKNHPQVLVLKVDVDMLADVSNEFNVASLPTIVFYRQGKELDRIIGANKAGILNKLQAYSQ